MSNHSKQDHSIKVGPKSAKLTPLPIHLLDPSLGRKVGYRQTDSLRQPAQLASQITNLPSKIALDRITMP